MNQKQQLEKDIQALEAKLNEMKATVEAMPSDAPARWAPKDGEHFYVVYPNYVVPQNVDKFLLGLSRLAGEQRVGNVHRTKEDAENYRLRLESFVPALGPETPGDECLKTGFYSRPSEAKVVDGSATNIMWLRFMYQAGSWHPTREAAEEWLAKYGVVRGYTK